MSKDKIFSMLFCNVFPMLIAKAERKNRTKEEVYLVTSWLTGYSFEDIDKLLTSDKKYGDFFKEAPKMNPYKNLIKGSICGIKVEDIQDPLMQDIRYLDKLVDELAKGKKIEKILRNSEDSHGK